MQTTRYALLALALAFSTLAGPLSCASASGDPLPAYAHVEDAGFSADALEEARAFAQENRAAAVLVLHRGYVVAAWGAVDRPFNVHSIRKSLAGALYGIAIDEERLNLGTTLGALGLQDNPPLTSEELSATFGDLVAARSGVYRGAAYAGADQESERPARGSHPPGAYWYYNNWDFNAAEAAFESQMGDIYRLFDERVAVPLGMQDYLQEAQFEVLEPSQSHIPAHTFRLSARDLARFGQLYIQHGNWQGRQIVPEHWVRASLTPHSEIGDGRAYGYLWWIYQPGSLGDDAYPTLNREHVFLARGSGGQALFLAPGLELVIVHLVDTDHSSSVRGPLIWQLAERIAAAQQSTPVANPEIAAVSSLALSDLPPPIVRDFHPVHSDALSRIIGDYVTSDGGVIRVFEFDRRAFINVPGQGEAELFLNSTGQFTVRVLSGVTVEFQREGNGPASGVTVRRGDLQVVGIRRGQPGAPPNTSSPRRRYGLSVAAPEPGLTSLTIQQVAAGGIAEERGVRAGDELIALNGEPVATMSRQTFGRHMTTSPLVLQLMREGSLVQVELAFDP